MNTLGCFLDQKGQASYLGLECSCFGLVLQ
jgi:hypothetical protein